MVNAQEWLKKNYKKKKKNIEEIKVTFEEGEIRPFTPITPVFPKHEPKIIGDHKLEGELKIDSYPNLTSVSLVNTEGITKLTIKDCPNLETLNVAANENSSSIRLSIGLE